MDVCLVRAIEERFNRRSPHHAQDAEQSESRIRHGKGDDGVVIDEESEDVGDEVIGYAADEKRRDDGNRHGIGERRTGELVVFFALSACDDG